MLICIRSVYLISVLLLFLACILESVSDRCYNNVKISADREFVASESGSLYTILENSQKCAENYEEASTLGAEYEPPLCPSGLLSVSITPIVRMENNNLLPHIELNISVAVYEHADSVTLRLQCLHAPDSEDIYCHDAIKMTNGGKWLWPCRAVVFNRKDSVAMPFYFGFSCFRMFGLSQYAVNVTVLPQQCRSRLLITSPSDSQLSPEIAEYYANKNISSPHWSPLLIVDFGDEDGLWLRVEGPPSSHARIITVSTFERNIDGALHALESVNIIHPSTGFKWRNVAKGEYVVYAHIPRHDCLLTCDSADHIPCRLCAHTSINFTLPADRASLSWKGLRRMRDSSPSILYAFGCVLVVVASCSSLYLFILRRRARRAPERVREIELRVKPSVLLLTPDDCAEHATVILALSHVLEKHIGVNILLDHHEMSNSVIRPYRWLVDSICRASNVLIVVSPCTQLVLNGEKLKRRRPFPDFFVPAMNLIMREGTESSTPSKYIICRLPYSPNTPEQLKVLGFPEIEIPSNFSRLTALIHSIDVHDPRLPSGCTAMDEFTQAVEAMTNMTRTNAGWMEERLVNESLSDECGVDMDGIPKGKFVGLETNDQRAKAAEMFGLLPPEENEVVDDPAEFSLLPADSSDEG